MENNIFYKQNKNKFNPDIENKYKELLNYREKHIFNSSNSFYNPITGIVPNNVKKIQDLLINNNNSNKNISKLIMEKEKERNLQDSELLGKPNIINQTNKINNNNNTINISDFNKLKNNSNKSQNNEDYIILDNLKKLGIL
jgi:hypothetical protein